MLTAEHTSRGNVSLPSRGRPSHVIRGEFECLRDQDESQQPRVTMNGHLAGFDEEGEASDSLCERRSLALIDNLGRHVTLCKSDYLP